MGDCPDPIGEDGEHGPVGSASGQNIKEDPLEGFVAALDQAELAELERRGHKARYDARSVIISEGDDSRSVVVLLSGRVKLSSDPEEGREVVLGIREAGELIGELSAIDGGPRSATITAIDDVETLIVGGEDFKLFLAAHPRVALVLMEVMAERLRDADRKRIEMTAGDTTGRVISRLVEMARRFGKESAGRTHITLPLTQEELAAWSGSSREAVAKSLAHLRDRGWIETSRKAITVLDLEELQKRSM